jgi:hypothetical protein
METTMMLVRLTACLSFLLYFSSILLRLNKDIWPSGSAHARWVGTGGCLFLVVHIFCAFQFVYHWSHAAAYEETARQTLALTGFDSGMGLYGNYLMIALWVADSFWWWLARDHYESRSFAVEFPVQGFLAFMWFNATAVFGHGFAQWSGVAAALLVAVVGYRRFIRSRTA